MSSSHVGSGSASLGSSNRRVLHLVIAVLIYLGFTFLLPTPAPLTKIGAQVLGIFAATIYVWTLVDLSWSSFVAVALLAFSGVASANVIYQQSWGNGIVPFLALCFVLNRAMEECGLSRRMALFFVTRRFCKGRPWVMLVMFFFTLWLICIFCTVSPIFVLFLAISEEIFKMTGITKEDRISEIIVATHGWMGLACQGMSPMSHVATVMGVSFVLEYFGINVSVLQFMGFGVVFGLVFFILCMLILRFVFRPDVSKLSGLDIEALKKTIPPMEKRERAIMIGFIILIFMWVAPDFLKMIPFTEELGSILSTLGTYWPPFIVLGVMGAIKLDDQPLIDFPKLTKSINWTAIIMLTALMCFSFCFNAESAGITAWLRENAGALFVGMSPVVFVAVVIAFITIATNFISNTVCAALFTVFVPIGMGIPGVNPIALGLLICAAANFGFATPAANPPCGIIAGCGWVRPSFMLTKGWAFTIAAIISMVCIGYPLACIILPYTA